MFTKQMLVIVGRIPANVSLGITSLQAAPRPEFRGYMEHTVPARAPRGGRGAGGKLPRHDVSHELVYRGHNMS